jgi:hypothetical protein
MGARLVLLAFGLLYALVAVAMSPAHAWIAPVDDWIWAALTVGTYGLLLSLNRPAQWLADTFDMQGQMAVLTIVAGGCLALAIVAILWLVRRNAHGKAFATFLLMLALTVPAGVVLTLYKFSTFGH